MSHKIARLLGEAEDKFGAKIEELEAACGYPSQDVRVLSATSHIVRQKITDMDLDPDDTTAEELHHALIAKYQNDAQMVEADLGLNNLSQGQKFSTIVELAKHCLDNQEFWTLKSASIKLLLKKLPPLKAKKALGYRSLDSMLKRAEPALILAAAKISESKTWQQKWHKAVAQLASSNYEARGLRVEIVDLEDRQPTLLLPELATVILLTSTKNAPVDSLGQILEILIAAQQLPGQARLRLAKLHPALRWWAANEHLVAWVDNQPISLNIFDVAGNIHNKNFEQRSYAHAGQKLWQKLSESYRELMSSLPPEEVLETKGQLFDQPQLLPVLVEVED